jgi:DNA polymerase III sliding clamp (beta) subunit (PCNA family)
MSDKTELNRESLAKIVALVRPALHAQNYIPALQHIRFDGKYATAYNDISAISVACDLDVERCIPGETLVKALGSFNAQSVAFSQGKEGVVTISSGRSRLKLPTLAIEAFPLQWPDDDGREIELTEEMLTGIQRCLLSVGADPTHPEQMGVTLDAIGGKAVLFSTDNFTISRYETSSKVKLPGDTPVILPTFFCEQLLALSRAFPKEEPVLVLRGGSLMAEFGKAATLFSKTLVEQEAPDFPAKFKAVLKDIDLKELPEIPDGFDSALQRALLVMQSEQNKRTAIELEDTTLTMHSSSSMGDADDKLKLEAEASFDSPESVGVDPGLVARGAKQAARLGFTQRALVLADKDAQFVHLIAYLSK